MKRKYTKIAHERHLNEFFRDSDNEQVFEAHEYLTNKSRYQHISRTYLRYMVYAGKMGSLLRRKDPVSFTVSYNDTTPKQ